MSNEDNINNIRRADEGNDPLVRGELLLSRLVDGEASEQDWEDFRSIAGRGAGGLWRALAEAQRDQAVLSIAVGESVRSSELVGLPGERRRGGEGVIARITPWAGWAAAACVAVIWGVGMVAPKAPRPAHEVAVQPEGSGSVQPASYDEAFDDCMRKGQQDGVVQGVVPERIVLSTRVSDDGRSYEMITIRQVIERRVVTDAYRFGTSESGAIVPVRTSMPAARPVGSFD